MVLYLFTAFEVTTEEKMTELGAFFIIDVMDVTQIITTVKIPAKPAGEIQITPGMLPSR